MKRILSYFRRPTKEFYIKAAVRPVGRMKSDIIEAKTKDEARELFLEKVGDREHVNIVQIHERKEK